VRAKERRQTPASKTRSLGENVHPAKGKKRGPIKQEQIGANNETLTRANASSPALLRGSKKEKQAGCKNHGERKRGKKSKGGKEGGHRLLNKETRNVAKSTTEVGHRGLWSGSVSDIP